MMLGGDSSGRFLSPPEKGNSQTVELACEVGYCTQYSPNWIRKN